MRWLTAFFVLAIAPCAANANEATAARIAQTCTAQGAFGHEFGETHVGRVTAKPGPEWAPFSGLSLLATEKSYRTWRIAAFAQIGEAQTAPDERQRQTDNFIDLLDKALQAGGRFTMRDALPGYLKFRRLHAPDGEVTLTIIRTDYGLEFTCENGELAERAREEGPEEIEF